MSLRGNYSVLLKSPGRSLGGSTVSDARANFNTPGSSRCMFVGSAAISALSGVPNGYKPGRGAWIIPVKDGAISSYAQAQAVMTASLAMAAGVNISGTTTITFTLPNAAAQLVVSASGTASITWSSTAGLAGALQASGTASFTFTPSAALLGALAGLTASGQVAFSGTAVLTAIGTLAGDIVPYTELSPESLAAAVRDMVLETGPDGTFTLAEVLRIIVAHAAGLTSIGPGTAAFKAISDGSKTRIEGEADSSGNRTSVTLDPS